MAKSANEDQVISGLNIDIHRLAEEDLSNPLALAERVYQIWWRWADFHLYVVYPHIDFNSSPTLILPEVISGTDEVEFVYSIHDYGSKLSTSKGEEMMSSGMSMHKLYLTIEKMIYILLGRLKSGGIDMSEEIKIAFGGHELAQRKAFESIINLTENIVVINFEPGEWGEYYLRNVKRLAAKGFGYPAGAPRENFKQPSRALGVGIKR